MTPASVLTVGANHHVRGGSDRYFLELNRLLAAAGHPVATLSARHPDDEPSAWRPHFPAGVDLDRPRPADAFRYIYSPAARRAMDQLLDRTSVDIAHLQIYQARLTSSILRPLVDRGIPIVQTLHDFKPICPAQGLQDRNGYCDACRGRSYWRAVAKRCKRGSLARSAVGALEAWVAQRLGSVDHVERFIAVCDYQRRKLVELGMPPDSVTTIHNFIEARELEPAGDAGSFVLYFGRLVTSKGLLTLLEAMRSLPEVELRLAGRGPDRGLLERRIVELGLERVRLVGFQEGRELETMIRSSACTVLPATALELCPLSLLESLALGRPVVASRIGGIPEIVRHGIDGLLVEPGNPVELARSIGALVAHPTRARDMGMEGRRHVMARFGPADHLQRLREVYAAVS